MIYTLIKRDLRDDVESIISFDSINSIDESWSATVSTQVVEKGFNISDNVNIEPEVYSIDAVISSYSLFKLGKEITWDGERFKSRNRSNTKSHIEARDELIDIFKSGSVLTLLESTANSNSEDLDEQERELKAGHFKEIDDCVITSMSISQSAGTTGVFFVSLKIQKVYVATVSVGTLPEGETIALLTPMKAKETAVASTTSKGKEVDELGNEVALQPDDGVIPADDSSAGLSWDDGYAILQRDLSSMRDDLAAIQRTREYMRRNNSYCELGFMNGSYVAKCVPAK